MSDPATPHKTTSGPRVIVDAGGRAGLSAAWYASRYPGATIYAVEMERSNFAVLDLNSAPYLNIVPGHLRVEIGSIILGERLARTRAATEAFFLMIKHAFEDLGYHRVEWKANHLNKPSCSAAARLGFVFEGIFR